MNSSAALQREIDALEDIQRDIVAISRRTDNERKRELVRLRKELSLQVGRVRAEGERLFAPGDARLAGEFRSRLSEMRTAIALHQAKWPAVILDDADDDYTRSVAAVRSARDDFLSWTRAALADLGQSES